MERLPRLRVAFAHGGGSFPRSRAAFEHRFEEKKIFAQWIIPFHRKSISESSGWDSLVLTTPEPFGFPNRYLWQQSGRATAAIILSLSVKKNQDSWIGLPNLTEKTKMQLLKEFAVEVAGQNGREGLRDEDLNTPK